MKPATALAALFLLALPAVAVSAEPRQFSAPSKIESVTVFGDRAQVTRKAVLQLEPGSNLVSFDGLPQLMAEESLRVEGKGTGRARIAGITVKNVFLEKVQEKRVQELEEEINTLNRKVESIEAKRKALVAQRAFLDSIKVGWGERISREIGAGKPSTAEMTEVMRFVGDGVGKVEEQIYDAEGAKRPLLQRIAALKKELEQSRTDRMKEVRSVQVAVDAERRMDFAVELSYLVTQASWEPTYDLRLAPDGKQAELVYRALVRQKTGEDWPGVKLSLSTAKPEVGGAPPELFPWHIQFYEPPRPIPYATRLGKGAAEMTMAAPAAPPAPAADQMEEAPPITAEFEEGQTSVLFNVRTPVDVPADGTQAGSVITVEKVPVSPEYVTIPKFSPRVYLKSEVTNSTPYPLLAGSVNIFNADVFTGKSHLKTVASGEKFDLFFGSDDQIKVKRESERVRKQAGLLGSNSITYHISNELENFKKVPVSVSLMDQLPMAGNAEIKVKLEDASPRPDETKEDGTLVWKVSLAPGEKKNVKYEIVIEYPKGKELVGAE